MGILQVKRIHVQQRENPIVNRLNKTKVEKFPDLREEREARQRELRSRDRDALQAKVSGCSSSSFPFQIPKYCYAPSFSCNPPFLDTMSQSLLLSKPLALSQLCPLHFNSSPASPQYLLGA